MVLQNSFLPVITHNTSMGSTYVYHCQTFRIEIYRILHLSLFAHILGSLVSYRVRAYTGLSVHCVMVWSILLSFFFSIAIASISSTLAVIIATPFVDAYQFTYQNANGHRVCDYKGGVLRLYSESAYLPYGCKTIYYRQFVCSHTLLYI